MEDTRRALLENFDEDVHIRLKLRLADAREQLDRVGRKFWDLTGAILSDRAEFDEANLAFDLVAPPAADLRPGRYHLISRNCVADRAANEHGYFLYRLSHPLGENVITKAKAADTPVVELRFDVTNHPTRVAIVETLKGRCGWLTLRKLITNPPVAIIQEIQGAATSSSEGGIKDFSVAIVQQIMLEEIARAAVDLHAGYLRFTDEELLKIELGSTDLDKRILAHPDEPIPKPRSPAPSRTSPSAAQKW